MRSTREWTERRLRDRREVQRSAGFLFVVVSLIILGIGLDRATSWLDSILPVSMSVGSFSVGLRGILRGNRGLWWSGGRIDSREHALFDKDLDESSKTA
jgi:hypothetical protein